MIYNSQKNNIASAPKHDIDPKLKLEKEWNLEVAQYIYYYHSGSWLAKRQEEFDTLRSYARGEQDTEQYKSIFIGQEANNISTETADETDSSYYSLKNHRMGFANIDFTSRFSPAPNILTTLQGIMSSQKHTIRVFATDENSNNDRKAIEYRLMAQMQYKELYDSFAAVLGQQENAPIPSTMEELKMYGMLGGFKLPYEVGIQELVDYTLKHDGADTDLEERIYYDFASIGMSACRDDVDQYSQRAGYKYMDPGRLIVQGSDDNRRFGDIQFWAYQEYMTIYDLRTRTGWPEQKILQIANQFNGNQSLGNVMVERFDTVNTFYDTGECNYNDIRVPVLYYEQLTVDSTYWTEIKSESEGNIIKDEPYLSMGKRKPRIKNNEKRKTKSRDIHTWYCGYWVQDTNDVFGIGKKFDQPFDVKLKEPRPSLHFYCLPFPSMIKQIKPILDDISMLFYRYQNDKATAAPANGLSVDTGTINENKIGNKKLHPFDTIKIYKQSGILLYSMHRAPIPGQTQQFNNVLPFNELPGGIGQAVKDWILGTSNAYQQLAVITGIDRMTLNSITPSGETTATQIKTAMANTKDSLKTYYNSAIKIKESLATNIAIQVQQLVVNNKESGYNGIISKAKLEAIRLAGSTPPAEYGLEIIVLPNDDEIAQVINSAQLATQGGKNGIPALTFSEYLFIYDALKTGKPIQHVIAYIAYKEKLRDEQAAAISAQAQQMDTMKGVTINKEKVAGEIAVENAKTEGALKQIVAKGVVDAMLAQKKSEAEIISKVLEMGFDVGMAKMNQPPMQQNPEMTPQIPMQ
jgi:hypothetical protein